MTDHPDILKMAERNQADISAVLLAIDRGDAATADRIVGSKDYLELRYFAGQLAGVALVLGRAVVASTNNEEATLETLLDMILMETAEGEGRTC